MSSGSRSNVAAGAPLALPPPVELPTAGVITTGLVVRSGGDTLVPATESDSPTATGRTGVSAATGAGAEPVAGTAVGVAVAVIAVAVAVVTGTGAAAPTPNPETSFAAGRPGTVVPAVGARFGAEFAAGVPTVDVGVLTVTEVDVGVVVGALGATPPPVRPPGPAPDGSAGAGAIAALVAVPVCVGPVCANPGDSRRATNDNAAPAMLITHLMVIRM